MTDDYPNVRKLRVCPLCAQAKDPGLLVCWRCYRVHEIRHGLPDDVAVTLDAEEARRLSRGGKGARA